MRMKTLAAALVAVGITISAGAAALALSIPSANWVTAETAGQLEGDRAALEAAINASSPVRYRILVVDHEVTGDKTTYLEQVAATWEEPGADTLLLVIFTKANNDIRFYMGASFRQEGVTVAEMLGYVRSTYLPKASKGDAAGALADLIRLVNDRMGASPAAAEAPKAAQLSPREAMQNLLTHLGTRDAKSLAAMVGPQGLVIMPYRNVGAPDEGFKGDELLTKLSDWLAGAAPRVVAYRLGTERRVDVVVTGFPDEAMLHQLTLRQEANGQWHLWLLTYDDQGLLKQQLADYQKPFHWLTVTAGTAGRSNIIHDRESADVVHKDSTTASMAEARAFLPGVVLPPALEGKLLYLFTQTDKQGNLVAKGISAAENGFWVRQRPQGDHRTAIAYGSDITAAVRHTIVAGRPAVTISFSAPKGPLDQELWLDDGEVVYELRTPGDLQKLIQLAESMR